MKKLYLSHNIAAFFVGILSIFNFSGLATGQGTQPPKPSDCFQIPVSYACIIKATAASSVKNPAPPSETKVLKVKDIAQVTVFVGTAKYSETWNMDGVCIYRDEKARPGKFLYFDRHSEYFNLLGNPLAQFQDLPADTTVTSGTHEGKKVWILKNSKFELISDQTTLLPITAKWPTHTLDFEFASNPPQVLNMPEEKREQLKKAREYLGVQPDP